MNRGNICVVITSIALGGLHGAVQVWLYLVSGKSIVSHMSVTSQSLVSHKSKTLNSNVLAHNFGCGWIFSIKFDM
jgi:hypothetical protein